MWWDVQIDDSILQSGFILVPCHLHFPRECCLWHRKSSIVSCKFSRIFRMAAKKVLVVDFKSNRGHRDGRSAG
jgi:hypothetical protein